MDRKTGLTSVMDIKPVRRHLGDERAGAKTRAKLKYRLDRVIIGVKIRKSKIENGSQWIMITLNPRPPGGGGGSDPTPFRVFLNNGVTGIDAKLGIPLRTSI